MTDRIYCKFCGKSCGNRGGLIAHMHCCKSNPNRQSYYHSPKAGRKKGKTYFVWNKGFTKENNIIVAQAANTLHEKYVTRKIIPSFLGKHHSKAVKQRLSNVATARHLNGWDNQCGRAKKLKYTRKDGNIITVDGSWEYHVAEYFDSNNINWVRNTKRFEYINLKGNKATYCPDFYLPDIDTYIEIKGYETDLDKCKWNQFTYKLQVWKKQDLLNKGISIKQIYVPLPKSG